jgi:hypothetical protein
VPLPHLDMSQSRRRAFRRAHHHHELRACAAFRDSALVVLIMGGGYGDIQPASGLSATHEEYGEAKGQRPVLAFVQDGVVREPAQAEFVREAPSASVSRSSLREEISPQLSASTFRKLS